MKACNDNIGPLNILVQLRSAAPQCNLTPALPPSHPPQVNNAARFHFGPLEKAPADAWQRLWSTNVVGYAMHIREALPHFRKHGKGAVVNMASVSSFVVRAWRGRNRRKKKI